MVRARQRQADPRSRLFFTRHSGSGIDPGAFGGFQIFSPQPERQKKKNKVCLVGERSAVAEILFQEVILEKEASQSRSGAQEGRGAAGSERVNAAGSLGLSGKAQVFGKRCTNEWNPQ